jgi:hypothetical protein
MVPKGVPNGYPFWSSYGMVWIPWYPYYMGYSPSTQRHYGSGAIRAWPKRGSLWGRVEAPKGARNGVIMGVGTPKATLLNAI